MRIQIVVIFIVGMVLFQENQEVLAKNQAILAQQNNKIVETLQILIKGLDEEPEDDGNLSIEEQKWDLEMGSR